MEVLKVCAKQYRPGEIITRQVVLDESLMRDEVLSNYIWHVEASLIDDSDFDDRFQIETFVGFVISARDNESVWTQMLDVTELGDHDYDNYKWQMRVIGIDLTNGGDRIIESNYLRG